MIYRLLRALLRHALVVFFRQIDVEGQAEVPASGPLLLAANHPNTLIDVLLIATCLDRRVGFVAKATLFTGPVAPLLRFLGAVPVARAQDGALDDAARERNARALAACEEAVARGEAVLIFPEGVSQDAPRLQQLRTGLARIALGAEARAPGQVRVVPVGLSYDDPGTFRSRAGVRFGAPIRVAPFAERGAGEAAAPDAVRALTECVREALLGLTVHVDDPALDPLLRELDLLYGRRVEAEAGSRLAAPAAIARALNAFAASDPARLARVREQLASYRGELEDAHVTDLAVRAAARPRPRPLEDLGFFLGAPLAVWGIVNHLLLYQLPRVAVALLTPDRLYTSTVKLLTGLVALAACYSAQTALAWQVVGPSWALVYLGTLPLGGLVALLWLEGLGARLRARRARALRRGLDPERLRALEVRREGLVRELDRARADFLARELARAPAPGEADPL